MEYQQQYQQGARHPQSHLPSSQYPPSAASGAANSNIASPRQQQQQGHQPPVPSSPVVPSQSQPYPPQNSNQQPGYAMQHQIGYPQHQPYNISPYMANSAHGISTTQAAAAMATAAASGTYHYPQVPDPSYRGAGIQVKAENRPHPGSPRQQIPMGVAQPLPSHMAPGQHLPQRHVNHAGSPPMQPPTAMGHAQARASVPPQVGGQQPGQAPQASPEAPGGGGEEAPLYVNAKQFHRILKRRVARQKLEDQLRLTNKTRKPYLHESRHNHAMRRPRGPGGRFLTAEEVAAQERRQAEGGDGSDVRDDDDATPVRSGSAQPPTSGAKRKADDLDGEDRLKKSKMGETADNGDDDEEGDADDDDDEG